MSIASFIHLCQLPHLCQARRGGTEVLHSLDATGMESVRMYDISLLNPYVHVNFIMVFFP